MVAGVGIHGGNNRNFMMAFSPIVTKINMYGFRMTRHKYYAYLYDTL